jgi:hypothetical protein
MGEYADLSIERFTNPDPFRPVRPRKVVVEKWDYASPEDCIWTTAEGVEMRFGDMEERHRTYALRSMARKGTWDTPSGRALIACGVHDWVRKEIGVPIEMPDYPKLFETNQTEAMQFRDDGR